ncbi:hypothetical protein PRIC2_003584 [Phytophthora ramorum]
MRDELREVDEERGETSNHGNSMESTAGQGRYVVPFTMSREEEAVGMEMARSQLPQLMAECAAPGKESTDAVSSSSWTRVKSRKKSTGVLLWEKRSVKAKREPKKKWGTTASSASTEADPKTAEDSGPVTYSVRSSTTVNAPISTVLKTLDASVATAHRSFTRIIYGNLVADTSVLFHSSTLGTAFLAEDANDSFEMLAVRWLVCRCSNPMVSDCDFCLQEYTKRHSVDELTMNGDHYNNNKYQDNDEDEISVGYSHEGLHALDEMPVAYKLFRSMETRHCPELLESHRVVRSKVPLGGFLLYPTDSSDKTDVVFYMSIAQDRGGNRTDASSLSSPMLTRCSDRQFRALQSVVKQMAHQIDRLNNAVDSYKMSLHLESLRTLQWLCENSASVRNSKFVALTLFTRVNHADMSQQNEVEAGEVAVYYLKVKGSAKLMKVAANMRCCDPVLQLHKPVITRNTWALDSKSSVHSSGYDFRQLPIVLGPQQARFYAGVPLTDSKKRFRYGALAVFDAAINPGEDDDLPMKKTLQALQVCAREAVMAMDDKRKELELRTFLQAPLIQLRQSEPAMHLSTEISQSSPRWRDIVEQESLDGDSDDNDKIDEAQRRLDYELRNARTKSDAEFPNSGSKARVDYFRSKMHDLVRQAQDTQAQMVENSLVMERHGVPIV